MLRVCFLGSSALMQLNSDGLASGPLASLGDILLQKVRNHNFSLGQETQTGTIIDSVNLKYDGCIGSLQRNESDFLLTVANFPVIGPNLKHAPAEGNEKMGILSAYIKPYDTDGHLTDVLDMMSAFSSSLWLLFGLFFFVIFMMLAVSLRSLTNKHRIRRKAIVRSMTIVIACIMKQHSSKGMTVVRSTNRLLYLTATVLSLYGIYYLTSLAKTEMVVIRPPRTIQSYSDIIDSGVRPAWMSGHGAHYVFKVSADGTKEKQIWDQAVAKGLSESLVDPSLENMIKHGKAVALQKEVLLIRKFFGSKLLQHGCSISQTSSTTRWRSIHPLYRYDDSARETLEGSLFNQQIASANMTSN